jgi:pyruvate dehydrogenase E2 component (dihydrolipoamide acetyltransferase)
VGDGSKAVQVGKAIAILGEEGDEITGDEVNKLASETESQAPPAKETAPKEEPKPQPPKEEPKPAAKKPEPEPEPSAPRDHIFASPIARRLALERGIPLTQVKGTGPNGRIIKSDIESYKAPAAAAAGKDVQPAPSGEVTLPSYTDIPLSNMRKVIAQRLAESKSSTPHYYLTAEINLDRVLKLRQAFNAAAKEGDGKTKDGVKAGTKLSINDFVLKAAAIALQDVPEANSAWHGDFIRQCVSGFLLQVCSALSLTSGVKDTPRPISLSPSPLLLV